MSHTGSPGTAGQPLKRPSKRSTLRQLNKDQICFIGNTVFGMEMVNSPAVLRETLIGDVAAALVNSPGCGCGGVDLPCNPEVHTFSPDLFGAAGPIIPITNPTIGSLLGVPQAGFA